MTENNQSSNNHASSQFKIRFGKEIEIEECGFSFRPIRGFELEIDGSAYMYSEDGNIEVFLIGGVMENESSIAELNDRLAREFLENMDALKLHEAGTATIQGITGFMNEIHFFNAEEEGSGNALICSPYLNQYFFMLGIASTNYWHAQGQNIYNQLLSKIHFHSHMTPGLSFDQSQEYPDLTIEVVNALSSDEDFSLTIEKEDITLLLAGRTQSPSDEIAITEIIFPGDQEIYRYSPHSGDFASEYFDQPLIGTDGEVCLILPCSAQKSLSQGQYRFSFATLSGTALEEVQTIIRSGRGLGMQKIDLNLWLASESEKFCDGAFIDQFESELTQALEHQLNPFDLTLGEIEHFLPAPDELGAFSKIHTTSDLADCSYMMAESFSNRRALNIGFVDQILFGDKDNLSEVSALSAGSPGMILVPASPHACILLAWSAFENDIDGFAKAIIQQLIKFCGIVTPEEKSPESQPLVLNQEIAWQLRRHPIFYPAG